MLTQDFDFSKSGSPSFHNFVHCTRSMMLLCIEDFEFDALNYIIFYTGS